MEFEQEEPAEQMPDWTGGPALWGVTGRARASSCRHGGRHAVFRAGERGRFVLLEDPPQLLLGGGQDGTSLG